MTHFGLAIPQILTDGLFDARCATDLAYQAEESGFHSLWVGDGLTTPGVMDAWTILSYVGASTTSLYLGTSVLVLPWRNPIEVAKAAATLDHLTNGRVILGVGIGDRVPADAAFSVPTAHRASFFEEQIELIRKCWNEQPVTDTGGFWNFPNITVEPKPLQTHGPAIWFGGNASPALHRAARLGDGWMGGGSSSTAAFIENLGTIRKDLKELHREPTDFALAKRVFIHVVSEDRVDSITSRLSKWSTTIYGDTDIIPNCAIVGDPTYCIAKLSNLLDQDLNLILLDPLFDTSEQARRLQHDVLPELR
jgi:alkanesulfonate monooxygenase SsuD/methylene tetrahydromethanopterin reductase-like flavin-dependent oxidoreductase (luciferase family)